MQVLEVGTLARPAQALALAHVVGHLDLDAIRAPVGELAHAGGTRAYAREIEHGKAVKCSRGLGKRHEGFRQTVSGGGQSAKWTPLVYHHGPHPEERGECRASRRTAAHSGQAPSPFQTSVSARASAPLKMN